MKEEKAINVNIQSLIGVVNIYSDKDIEELKCTLSKMLQGVVDTAHKQLKVDVEVHG